MRRERLTAVLILPLLATITSNVSAGSYIFVGERVVLDTMHPQQMPAFSIVHPPGYDGSSGVLDVKICVLTGSEVLTPVVQAAIDTWNSLEARTDNCDSCILFEETPPPVTSLPAFSSILHELGHCALGLDHINLVETVRTPNFFRVGTCDVDSDNVCGESTSFTQAANMTEIDEGAGPPVTRGDENDLHFNKCFVPGFSPVALAAETVSRVDPLGPGGGFTCPSPPECCPDPPRTIPWQIFEFAWFRIADNNPVVVDGTVIDQLTFTRNQASLPAGHDFAASANRVVAEQLGSSRTQSVMYSGIVSLTRFFGLSADDVNMVKMGATGQDLNANTADDYIVNLVYEPDCMQADIRVDFGTIFVPINNPAGCMTEVTLSFPQPAATERHWSLTPAADPTVPDSATWILVELNDLFSWDFSIPVFRSTFDSGDLSEWSEVVQELAGPG